MTTIPPEQVNGSGGATAGAGSPAPSPECGSVGIAAPPSAPGADGGSGGAATSPLLIAELNDQLLRSWDVYIRFFTVFLTVNFAALGIVVQETDPGSTTRWVVGLTFFVQNLIAFVTGIAMAKYTRAAAESLESHRAPSLARFGALGAWGGIGNAIGNGVIGLTWIVVIFIG